jgi:MFS family permease
MTPGFLSHPQKRIVLTFSLAAFLFAFSTVVESVYLPIYLEKVIGLGRSEIGLLISLYALTLIILVAPFGHFSDRVSPKKIIQAGLLLSAAYCCLLAWMRKLAFFIPAQVIGGVGNSLVVIALPSLYYKHLNPSRRGQKLGAYMFASFLGFACGPLATGFLLRRCGFTYGEAFMAVGALMAGLWLFSGTLKDALPFKIRLFDYKQDIVRKEVFLLVCMLLAMGITFGNEQSSLALYMRDVIKLDDLGVGLVFAVLGSWIAILAAVTGTLYDRSRKVLLFICLGLVVSGSFHILTAFTKSYGSILGVRLLHTTGDAVVIFAMNAIIASIFPTHRMGGNVGFTTFFQTQGTFLGALASGFFDANYGSRLSFIVAGSGTIFVGFLLAANWRTMLSLSREL